MDAITLGPLVLPLSRLPGLLALIVLLVATELFNKKAPGIARWGWMTALAGVLGGRLAFAASTPAAYASEPWTLLYFWQPGYSWWGALLGALVFSLIFARKHPGLRSAITGILAITSLVGLLTLAVLPKGATGDQLPSLSFQDLAGQSINLEAYRGQPLVVNLWATWCPPCRREMPMLESYEGDERLQVVLINQGETLLAVSEYLQQSQLTFANLLLDTQQQAMQHYQAPGLPATLFYNAEGQLVDRHFGELSRGQIERFIQRQGLQDD